MICDELWGDLKIETPESDDATASMRDRTLCMASFVADVCDYQEGRASAKIQS